METASNRAELRYYLDHWLRRDFEALRSTGRRRPGINAIKTYLLEFHPREEMTEDESLALLADTVAKLGLQLQETEERRLLRLVGEDMILYIDGFPSRFVAVFATAPVDAVDSLITKIATNPFLDRAWLPAGLLQESVLSGRLYGFGVTFQDMIEQSDDELWPRSDADDLSLAAYRRRARLLAGILRDARELRSFLGLSKVSVLLMNEECSTADQFIINDLYYDGKIVSRGTSYDQHNRFLYYVLDMYTHYLATIEQSRLAASDGNIVGRPITVKFQRPIARLEHLVENMFNGTQPYRLWGIPDRTSEGCFEVYAVDLHPGSRQSAFQCQVTAEGIKLFIPSGACGNTVLRLLSNINRTVDAQATLYVGRRALIRDEFERIANG